MTIKFVLNEELQELDYLDEGYVYEAAEHPTDKNLMVVTFEYCGVSRSASYKKEDFESKFEECMWIRV